LVVGRAFDNSVKRAFGTEEKNIWTVDINTGELLWVENRNWDKVLQPVLIICLHVLVGQVTKKLQMSLKTFL